MKSYRIVEIQHNSKSNTDDGNDEHNFWLIDVSKKKQFMFAITGFSKIWIWTEEIQLLMATENIANFFIFIVAISVAKYEVK